MVKFLKNLQTFYLVGCGHRIDCSIVKHVYYQLCKNIWRFQKIKKKLKKCWHDLHSAFFLKAGPHLTSCQTNVNCGIMDRNFWNFSVSNESWDDWLSFKSKFIVVASKLKVWCFPKNQEWKFWANPPKILLEGQLLIPTMVQEMMIEKTLLLEKN